jgi:hypothetical protein
MNLIRALLSGDEGAPAFFTSQACVTVRYTAWKYAHEESLWRTLVNVILSELLEQADEHDSEKRRLRETLYGDVVETRRRLRVDWPRLAGALVGVASVVLSTLLNTRHVAIPPTVEVTLAGLALGGAAVTAFGVKWTSRSAPSEEKPSLIETVGSHANDIAQAFQIVDDVLATHRRVQYIEQFADSFEIIAKRFLNGRRLVVFIDDLDRCLPEKAVQVLEGIKLFLGVPGTVFVLGVDIQALAYAVELHYSQEYLSNKRLKELPGFISGSRYLEKVIQFPFHLPPMGESDMLASPLVAQLCEDKGDLRWLEIGIRGFAGNPRALKRFARIFRSRRSVIIADRENLSGDRELQLAKLVVLQEHDQWGELVDLIVKYTVSTPRSLLRDGPLALLERAAANSDERDIILNFTGTGVMSQLTRFAADDTLMRFLRSEPLYDGESPIDPLPLIRLGGGSEATPEAIPGSSSLEVLVRGLRANDPPTRARSISAIRDLSPQSRRQLVERLLSEATGQSQSQDPDAAGLPLTIMAIQSLYEQGIEPELISGRSHWFAELAGRTDKSGPAGRSGEALVNLLAEIGSADASPTSPNGVEIAEALTDVPASEDQLGATRYVQAIAEAIRRSSAPLTVGIFGKWGSGKTTFMRLLQHQLENWPGYVGVWVNSWTGRPDSAIDVLVEAVTNVLGPSLGDPARVSETSSSDVARRLREALYEALRDERHMVVFVDDIDRCVPAFQIEMMQAIRGVFRLPGVIIVMAADRDILVQAADAWLGAGSQSGENFVEELIDVPFVVAPDRNASRALLHSLLEDELDDERIDILSRYLDPNPRKVKQFINRYRLCLAVADQEHETIDRGLLAALTLIASRWPRLLKEPALLVDLWKASYDLDLSDRSDLFHSTVNELELLDADDLASFLKRLPPPAYGDVLDALRLLGNVLST